MQTHGDLLLTVNAPNIWVLQGYSDPNDYFKASITETFTKREKTFTAGLRVFDISKPSEPREIGFMPVDGLGLHRLWYVGGRYAYASCHWQGFTDHVLAVIDMAEPTRPEVGIEGPPAVGGRAMSEGTALKDKVQELLDTAINPAVAGHGGYIELIDVKDSTVYIRMSGGCQGCGAADVTLKAGIERMIFEEIPEVTEVLDTTDHASGSNPYYAPSKA